MEINQSQPTTQPRPSIGFIGLGLMGTPMTRRLLRAGYCVNVWNRDASKIATLASAGAITCDTIAALVDSSDIVMMCVSDTDAVEQVVFGHGGVIESICAAKTLIDFSSIAPDATKEFARKLYDHCGAQWIDAPVSGGVAGAENGTLVVMAGGPADILDRLAPILACLSQRVTRMGEVGAGQATKVCNQILVSCNVMVMAEVLALAEKSGVDARLIPAALNGGFADSIPLQLTGTRMANRDLEDAQWHIKTLLKDLNLAKTLADDNLAFTPMAQLALELMSSHGSDGNLDRDPASLITLYDDSSST